jgi:DNA adenine methylase
MLSYIGGKSKIGKWIVPYYPKDMEVYLETFGGMFWCFFNMDLKLYPNLNKVVYNDFNPLNYNLFKCVQNPSELLRAINSIDCQKQGTDITPSIYKEQFISFQAEIFNEGFSVNPGDYEVAAKYVYILTQVSKPDWVEHFLKITDVENMDFSDVINKYDSESTYIYLDPPYWKTENYYSNHDFDRQDHERLANTLHQVKGKFSLSYYDFPLLSEWFPKDKYTWEMKQFAKAASAKKGEKQNMGEELLIMNY